MARQFKDKPLCHTIPPEIAEFLDDFYKVKKIPWSTKSKIVTTAVVEFLVRYADASPEEIYGRMIEAKYLVYQRRSESREKCQDPE